MRSLLARARDVRDVARTKLDAAVATVAASRETSEQLDRFGPNGREIHGKVLGDIH